MVKSVFNFLTYPNFNKHSIWKIEIYFILQLNLFGQIYIVIQTEKIANFFKLSF